jgi:hypothetical protein
MHDYSFFFIRHYNPKWVSASSTVVEHSQQEGFYRMPLPAARQTPNLEERMVIKMYISEMFISVLVHLLVLHINLCGGRVAWSVQRLPTGCMVRGSNPGGGEIFRTCPDRP